LKRVTSKAVPVYLDGTRQALAPGAFFPTYVPIRVIFGEPATGSELAKKVKERKPPSALPMLLQQSTGAFARGRKQSARARKQGLMTESKETKEMEPMWPSLVALLAAGGLYAKALTQSLAFGPRWLLMALVLFTLAPSEILHSRGHHRFCRPIGFFVISVVTIGMIVSVVLLVRAIPAHVVDPEQLLHSATALWVSNILVFAVWYWRLDAGGPHSAQSA
jgi:hypothetical protein